MKDEEEKMHEFMKDFTNAHDNLPKIKGIEGTFRAIKVSVKTFIVIGIIVAIIMLIPIVIMIARKASIVFTMDKQKYITIIERAYRQKLQIVEDNSTKKGNGVIIFKTEKEPIVEFKAVKTIGGGVENYYLEYEGNVLSYYMEHGEEEIFKGIKIEKIPKEIGLNMFKSVEVLDFKVYLLKENYEQIEEGVRQLIQLKKFMQKEIRTFEIPLYLQIGDYISGYDYKQKKGEENIIEQEKQNYYWYLKNRGEDISAIPEEDLLKMDRPQVLNIYIEGEKVIDKQATERNKLNMLDNDYKTEYITAEYNIEENYYKVDIKALILNCDKFQILEGNTNAEFDFSYQNKKYSIHYFDDKVHGKKLPANGDIESLKQVLKIETEYDYLNKKVNLIIP